MPDTRFGDESVPAFVLDAETFAVSAVRTFAFRLMQRYLRCSSSEIREVAEKVYCVAVPGSVVIPESALKRMFGLFAAPLYLLARKSWRWQPERRVDWQLDVEDAAYFESRFRRICNSLPGSVRLSSRAEDRIPNVATTKSATASVRGRAWLLVVLMPLAWPSLAALSRRTRLDLFTAFRGAWISYAVWEGYFSRYPCRDFITYADDGNEPSRAIAFRQSGGKRLTSVQNGDRALQPIWAKGDVDLYLMFGPHYERLVRRMGYRLGSTASVGSLALDRHYLPASRDAEKSYDILLLDSGALDPVTHSGLNGQAVDGEEKLFRLVGDFARRHPELRVACQMRPYAGDVAGLMDDIANELLGENVELLGNTGLGESYQSVRRARVAVTFQSTMGWEAFMLGATTLFANYSGLADQTVCDDLEYQIDSTEPDYAEFEEKVLGLLATPLETPPPVALDHICCFDGRTPERIVEALLGENG